MPKKTKEIIILILLILILIAINYPFLDNYVGKFIEGGTSKREFVNVSRVIDGDTIELEDNRTVRLMGINSPEKGEKYYGEAKKFLEDLILNKSAEAEFYGKDKYYRELAFIFLNKKNINVESVKNGFANVYLLEDKKYEKELKGVWENCVNSNLNYCESSSDKCAKCIELEKLDVNEQTTTLYNGCNFDCELSSWTIKDEGRKKFVFPNFVLKSNKKVAIEVKEGNNNQTNLFWKGEDYVWTGDGDSLFLRDNEGKLVLWESY